MVQVACNRAVQFGARCRETAVADGKCAEHQKIEAPRAPAPNIILVKFTLAGQEGEDAARLFRNIPRVEDLIETSHERVAAAAGLQFAGKGHTGYTLNMSGTPVFGKEGLRNIGTLPLRTELERSGFVLSDVHAFEKYDKQKLVLGYYLGGKPVELRSEQRSFIARSWEANQKYCHVYANIPESVGTVGGIMFKYLILEDRGDKLFIQVTKPAMDEPTEVAKSELANSRLTTTHAVEIVGYPAKSVAGTLIYADGLWGVK